MNRTVELAVLQAEEDLGVGGQRANAGYDRGGEAAGAGRGGTAAVGCGGWLRKEGVALRPREVTGAFCPSRNVASMQSTGVSSRHKVSLCMALC